LLAVYLWVIISIHLIKVKRNKLDYKISSDLPIKY
jgi:hypothetical protein